MAGQTYDRVLAIARIDPPLGYVDGATQNTTVDHADWRVDGGEAFEAVPTTDTDAQQGYVFAVTLHDGADHLELGHCDIADVCGWSAVDVSVHLGPGSPDPAFARTGIVTYPPEFSQQNLVSGIGNSYGVWPQADGRVLTVGAPTEGTAGMPTDTLDLIAFEPDGTLDGHFGKFGLTSLPAQDPGGVRLIPLGAGGWLVLFTRGPQLSHVMADGTLDAAFGTQGITTITSASAPLLMPDAAVSDGAGGFWMAGAAASDPSNPGVQFGFAMHVDGTGAELAFARGPDGTIVDAAIDPTGRAAFLEPDHATVDGTSVALPASAAEGAIAFAANGDVLVAHLVSETSGPVVHAHRIAAAAVAWDVPVAIQSQPFLAEAPDGAIYVAGQRVEAPDGECCKWFPDAGPDQDLAIARIVGSSLDPTFGVQGVGHASSQLSWLPMATESVTDVPSGLAIGPDGEPWMAGTGNTATFDPGGYTKRGPGIVIARFMR